MTGWARRLHALALRTYPLWFRRQFAGELDRVFAQRVAAFRAASRVCRLAWVAYLIGDAVLSGLATRVETWRQAWAQPQQRPPTNAQGRRLMSVERLATDMKLAVRHVVRAPLFTLLTTLSLGLGLGANAAIFSVVNAVLLRPLPYAAPERLVAIWSNNTRQGDPNNSVSPANFEAFQAAPSLERTEAMFSFLISSPIDVAGVPDYVQVATITPGMFGLLGRRPIIGTVFRADDHPLRVVLSYGYWQRRFGGDPDVLGRMMTFSGTPPVTFAIAGVMPQDFQFPYQSMLGPSGFNQAAQPDLYRPLVPTQTGGRYLDAAGQPARTPNYLAVVAKLREAVSIDRARADLTAIATARAALFPDTNRGWQVTVRPLKDQTVGSVRPALMILAAGVGLVLLVTCVNLANVMLARSAARRQDLAVRIALGATSRQLMRQALVESVVLSLLGGVMGLALARVAVPLLVALAPPGLPRLAEVSLDRRVVLVALALAFMTGILVGLVPALWAARTPSADALRESRRTTPSVGGRRMRSVLIVAEVALATALAVGAGLLFRSFVTVLGVDPGFRAAGLLTMQLSVPARAQQEVAAQLAFYDGLEARLRAVPGVLDVGGTTRLPLESTNVSTTVDVEGRDVLPSQRPEVELRRAVFDYFGAMGIPLLRGRTFAPTDGPEAAAVAVVNTAFVAKVFPHEDPIGRRLRLGPTPTAPLTTIVGVVGSVRYSSLEETPKPELYLYYRQSAPVQPFVVLRTLSDPAQLAGAAKQAVRDAGGDLPFDVKTMLELRDAAVAERRFILSLVALFGLVALALSAVGVYGVITLIAEERTPEVSLRLALGARPTQILRLLLSYAARLASVGVAGGTCLALVLAPLGSSQLYGVKAADPATFASVAVMLVAAAAIAAYVPARRATRVDPARALR